MAPCPLTSYLHCSKEIWKSSKYRVRISEETSNMAVSLKVSPFKPYYVIFIFNSLKPLKIVIG